MSDIEAVLPERSALLWLAQVVTVVFVLCVYQHNVREDDPAKAQIDYSKPVQFGDIFGFLSCFETLIEDYTTGL